MQFENQRGSTNNVLRSEKKKYCKVAGPQANLFNVINWFCKRCRYCNRTFKKDMKYIDVRHPETVR